MKQHTIEIRVAQLNGKRFKSRSFRFESDKSPETILFQIQTGLMTPRERLNTFIANTPDSDLAEILAKVGL